ncbi:MAG: 7-cyano-7-deazaguanine synthase [Verrucomicrobia bacterium]|nr:7-cyano-7-deazaguanine synthase [Verrucomicrobiota bacterium]
MSPLPNKGNVKPAKVLVLHSGGIDSTACLAYHLNRGAQVRALFIDFGQLAARQEAKASRRVCRHYNVPLDTLRYSNHETKFKDGLILGRNAFFLFAALTYLPSRSGLICYGAHAGTGYYDCSPQFVRSTRRIIQAYSQGAVDLSVPFLKFSKRQVVEYGRAAGAPLAATYSCERGGAKPCRHCATCRALQQIGFNASA